MPLQTLLVLALLLTLPASALRAQETSTPHATPGTPATDTNPQGGPLNAPPGTICSTPQGWCVAGSQGTPGAPCGCVTEDGKFVAGSLR